MKYAGFVKTQLRSAVAALRWNLVALTDEDVFFDLGCGCGDVLLAAKEVAPGCRCIGVEMDEKLASQASEALSSLGASAVGAKGAAAELGPEPLIYCGSIDDCLTPQLECSPCEGDEPPPPHVGEATVVFLFIGQWANLKLRPRLLKSLNPGTRLVSKSFTMGKAWPPDGVMCGPGGEQFFMWFVTMDRKSDQALLSDDEMAVNYGLHWAQPPPTGYFPIAF